MWRVGERDGDRGKPAGFLPRWDLLCSPSRARAHTDPLALQHPPPPNNNNHVGISGRKPSDGQWVSDQAAWGREGGEEGGKNLTGDLVF